MSSNGSRGSCQILPAQSSNKEQLEKDPAFLPPHPHRGLCSGSGTPLGIRTPTARKISKPTRFPPIAKCSLALLPHTQTKSENSRHPPPTPSRVLNKRDALQQGWGVAVLVFAAVLFGGVGETELCIPDRFCLPYFHLSISETLLKSAGIPTYICAHTLGNIHVCSARTPINKCVSTQRHSHIPRAIFILFQLQLLLRS